jgi:hypothetical protein
VALLVLACAPLQEFKVLMEGEGVWVRKLGRNKKMQVSQ